MESSVQEIFDRGELTKSPVYGLNLSYQYLIRLTVKETKFANAVGLVCAGESIIDHG